MWHMPDGHPCACACAQTPATLLPTQVCRGARDELQTRLKLGGPENFDILSRSGCYDVENLDDCKEYRHDFERVFDLAAAYRRSCRVCANVYGHPSGKRPARLESPRRGGSRRVPARLCTCAGHAVGDADVDPTSRSGCYDVENLDDCKECRHVACWIYISIADGMSSARVDAWGYCFRIATMAFAMVRCTCKMGVHTQVYPHGKIGDVLQ